MTSTKKKKIKREQDKKRSRREAGLVSREHKWGPEFVIWRILDLICLLILIF